MYKPHMVYQTHYHCLFHNLLYLLYFHTQNQTHNLFSRWDHLMVHMYLKFTSCYFYHYLSFLKFTSFISFFLSLNYSILPILSIYLNNNNFRFCTNFDCTAEFLLSEPIAGGGLGGALKNCLLIGNILLWLRYEGVDYTMTCYQYRLSHESKMFDIEFRPDY